MQTITGSIKRVTYFNNENAFAILKIAGNDDKIIPAKGIFPDCSVIGKEKVVNLNCSLTGDWKKDRKYGWQFLFSSIKIDNTGALFFLTNVVRGLGAKLACKIVDKYGDKRIFDLLENNPDELLNIKGIKQRKLKKIVDSWNRYKELRQLSDLFSKNDVSITTNLLMRIYAYFKEDDKTDTVKLIADNPYILTNVRGIGFKTCDKLALDFGIDPNSPIRIKALTDYILLSEASDSGHTYLTEEQVTQLANDYLYKDKENIDNENGNSLSSNSQLSIVNSQLSGVLTDKNYFYDPENKIISLSMYKYKESYIYKTINNKLPSRYKVDKNKADSFIAEKERELKIQFSKEQRETICDIATGGFSIFMLCGYAGTGKSTISKVILDFYRENFVDYDDIVCCAFTGMASKRIAELTGYKSSTIHSLLGFRSGKFVHNKDKKLDYKIVLLDEASMVNVDIFYALISALPEDAVFIMVGDDAQLPPIGAGNIFNDLMQKEDIPKVKLTRIFRQSDDSVLTYFASYIRQGKAPYDYEGNYKDFMFTKRDIPNYFKLKKELSDKDIKAVRDSFYEKIKDELIEMMIRTAENYKLQRLNKIWEMQVIVPMRVSVLGTNNLNIILQSKLNTLDGSSAEIKGFTLKQHDKVIHLHNKNMPCMRYAEYKSLRQQKLSMEDTLDHAKQERIYNGSIGLVVSIDSQAGLFTVVYPDNDNVVFYEFNDFKTDVDLGYALTIHKVQGNQFNYVFIPIINSFFIMLNSKLMYTAITRAIKKVFIIGQNYAFRRGCTNIKETKRQTFIGAGYFDK